MWEESSLLATSLFTKSVTRLGLLGLRVQPTDPAKKDINHNRNTPQHEVGARNLLLFPSYAREKANTMKVFDGPTLNADAFVWLRELVAHRAREMLILKELPSLPP